MKSIKETIADMRRSVNKMFDDMSELPDIDDKVEWNTEKTTETVEKRPDGTTVTTKTVIRKIKK